MTAIFFIKAIHEVHHHNHQEMTHENTMPQIENEKHKLHELSTTYYVIYRFVCPQ
jgi:hypothetical protein